MSRTYKSLPTRMHRRPKGKKRAINGGCRPGAVPPDSYDDLPICNLAWRPYKVARKMFDKGIEKEDIINCLKNKFNLKLFEVDMILKDISKNH